MDSAIEIKDPLCLFSRIWDLYIYCTYIYFHFHLLRPLLTESKEYTIYRYRICSLVLFYNVKLYLNLFCLFVLHNSKAKSDLDSVKSLKTWFWNGKYTNTIVLRLSGIQEETTLYYSYTVVLNLNLLIFFTSANWSIWKSNKYFEKLSTYFTCASLSF